MQHQSRSTALRASLAALAAAVLGLAAAPSFAANAVGFQSFAQGTLELDPGSSLTATLAGGTIHSYTDNPNLAFSAWAHAGRWWNFNLTSTTNVSITVSSANPAGYSPGFTVWASGNSPFDGGTEDVFETSLQTGVNTPHNFNAVGQIGDYGTGWMTGSNGNLIETLAYAVSKPGVNYAADVTGFGETITSGVHDVSASDLFEAGVTGSIGAGFAQALFTEMQAGWYTIYIGGTNAASTGDRTYTLDITASPTAVPLPGAVVFLGSGLFGLLGARRNRKA